MAEKSTANLDFDKPRDTPVKQLHETIQTLGVVTPDNNMDFPHVLLDNRFELRELVGQGGMCKVYKAFDRDLKRMVAVKVLHEKFRSEQDTDVITRFRGEGELVANLSHPDIIQVYHTTLDPKLGACLILELVEGPSLRDLLKEKTLTAKAAAEITVRLARAIEYAHHGRLGSNSQPSPPVIHRDIKPANVLLSGSESLLATPNDPRLHVKITDFGLGKAIDPDPSHQGLTCHGMIMGTPSYMSPEQARGEKNLTTAVDVYGLGATLYEMLTGRPPFSGPSISVVLHQVQEDEPIQPSQLVPRIPGPLSAICLKCLEKNPLNRYASAQELAEDLERWLAQKPTLARVPTWRHILIKWVKKNPTKAMASTGFFLLGSAVLGLGLYSWQQTNERRFLQTSQDSLAKQRLQLKLLHNESLAALNGILDLLTDDDSMRHLTGLEPLHLKLNQFYQRLVQMEGTEDVLDSRELGKAHLRLIRLISQKGNKADAITVIENGVNLYKRITSSSAPEPQDYYALGQIHLMAAEVRRDLGQYQDAFADLDKAQELFQSLVADGKVNGLESSPEKEIANTHHLRGVIHGRFPNQQKESIASYGMAIDKFRELLGANPNLAERQELEKGLARAFGYRGDVFLDQGNFLQADEDYWVSHRFRLKTACELTGISLEKAANPDEQFRVENPTPRGLEALFQLARSFGNFGSLHFRMGACTTANEFRTKSLKIQNQITAASPNITEYKTDLGSTLVRLSENTLTRVKQKVSRDESGDIREIERNLSRALTEVYEPLYRDDRASLTIRRGYGESLVLRGENALVKRELNIAEKSLEGAREVFERVVKQGRPGAMDYYQLARIYGMKATLAANDSSVRKEISLLACQNLGFAMKMGRFPKTDKEVRSDNAFSSIHDLPEFALAFTPSEP